VDLEYTVCDDFDAPFTACSSARLRIEMPMPAFGGGNLPPYAGDDYASTPINHMVEASWISNDQDADDVFLTVMGNADTLDINNLGTGDTIAIYATARGGSLAFLDNGNFQYTPPLNYYGPDHLTYYVCDLDVTPLCDTATIYLNVSPIRFDFGDLGPAYQEARHMIPLDIEQDGIPDLPGTYWLGQIVDAETSVKASFNADGDNNDFSNDERGVIFPTSIALGQDAWFGVIVNGYDPGMTVHFGIWIDWDVDGIFEDFYKGSGVTQSPNGRNSDTTWMLINIPPTIPLGMAFFRARAFQAEPTSLDYGRAMRSGEAEDYRWDVSGPLPVELAYFTAVAQGSDAILNWGTASEVENDYFSVQRSTDAVNWREITTVEGHGTTSEAHEYAMRDPNLESGLYYYRLQQFDYHGGSEFSHVQAVTIEGGTKVEETKSINVYPVPVHAQGKIYINGLSGENPEIRLFALNGSKAIFAPVVEGSLDLSNYHLPGGLYILEIQDGGDVYSEKILILD
jgi:hypothetical protein